MAANDDERGLVIAIEGNIGAGKTTFLQWMEEQMPDGSITIDNDKAAFSAVLPFFYQDPEKWAFDLQEEIGLARSRNVPHPEHGEIAFVDRSQISDYVFAEVNKNRFTTSQQRALRGLYNYNAEVNPLDAVIYLATDLKTCLENIKTRGRECEQAIDEDYLATVQAAYVFSPLKTSTFGSLTRTDKKRKQAFTELCREYTGGEMSNSEFMKRFKDIFILV